MVRAIVGVVIAGLVLAAIVAGLVELSTPIPTFANACPPEFPQTAYGCPQVAYDLAGHCCFYGYKLCGPGNAN